MIVEKLLGKLEKLLGGDAIESRWYEHPLYEFTLEKEVSEVTVEGHGWEWQDGDCVVYELNDEGWALATVYPISNDGQAVKSLGTRGFDEVKRVEGVVDVHEEEIGTTEWDLEVDVAAGSLESVERDEVRTNYWM